MAWQVLSRRRRCGARQDGGRADYVTLRAAEALRVGAGRSWLCSALEVRIGHRQQVVAGQIPFEPMNALHLRVVGGVKHTRHRDDHRSQAINRMDGMRVADLRVGDLRGHKAHPAKVPTVLVQAPIKLVRHQSFLVRHRFDIRTGIARLDFLHQADHCIEH
ncbi:hypothetical protein G6F59_014092 [Rhizopus arrhizus]|nr:hypothetical protein G6F59_014092 [Rhizopus arrhizus]